MGDNEVIRTLLGRRSIRRYVDKPVEDDKIDLLIRCAAAAPSAANGRPAHFVVITDRGLLDRLAEAHPYGKMLAQAPLAFAICAVEPEIALAKPYWEQDCAAAMENLLIAAQGLGLGAVWLGVCHMPDRGTTIKELLRVPEDVPVMGLAAIGYPDEVKDPHNDVPRERLHRNRW